MDLDRQAIGIQGKPALLLVDLSNGFADQASPLGCECGDVLDANRRLLGVFRALKLPIFFTTVVYYNDNQAQVFRRRLDALNILVPGSRWVDIHSTLELQADEIVVEKQWASAFFGTSLDQQLRDQSVESLVVTGLTTSGCVRATVVDGLQHDYSVVVPADAVADRNQEAHQANLFDMHAKYADVLSVDQVLEALHAGPFSARA